MLTQKDRAEIAGEYDRGIHPRKIALRNGISYGYVLMIAKDGGAKMRPKGCPLGTKHGRIPVNVERNQKMWELRKKGLPLQEIGETHGITREAVRLILKRFPPLPNPPREKFSRDEIKKLAASGLTREEIARKTGVPYQSVCMVARKMGLALKRKRNFKYDYGKIVSMWNSSLSMRKMARKTGATLGTIGVLVQRLRDKGYNLPFRRPRHN